MFPSFLTWPLHSTDVIQHIPDFLVAVLQRWITQYRALSGAAGAPVADMAPEHKYVIQHIPGAFNTVANQLSRQSRVPLPVQHRNPRLPRQLVRQGVFDAPG